MCAQIESESASNHSIEYSDDGRIGWLTLARPQALNAFTREMIEDIDGLLTRLPPSLHVLVIVGKGKAFCAGADLNTVTTALAEPDGLCTFLDALQSLFARIRSLPHAVLAGINGIAMGAGLELALCADIVVASETARIGDGHANVGLIPGAGSSALLPRLIGSGNAKYLQFTGLTMTAQELLTAGLITKVWPPPQFMPELRRLAETIADKSPLAIRHVKRLTNASAKLPVDEVLALEQQAVSEYSTSHDLREGISAFLQRRKPMFSGS
jgi:enoyl-CoA hydratase